MGCIPNNEICNNILKIYSSLQFDINNLITVCQVTTDYLKQNYNLQINNKTQKLDNNIKIYSTEYFCPKDYKSGKIKVSPNTVSIHHYNASWVTKASLFTKFKRLIKQIVKFIIGKKNYEKLKKKYKHDKN